MIRIVTNLIFASSLFHLSLAVSPQLANLGYAVYEGTFNSTSNVTEFLGIRFAAPPVGELLVIHGLIALIFLLSCEIR